MGSTDERQAVAAGDLPPTDGNAVADVANLPPPGFLAALPHAAPDATAVHKINLNLPAGDDPEEGQGVVAQETPTQIGALSRSAPVMHRSARRQKLSVSSTKDNLDNDGQRKDESTGVGLSMARGRKRSKYLLPPYTNDLDGLDLKKEEDLDARDVLLLVHGFAKDIFHRRYFPKAAEGFLGILRSSTFAQENSSGNPAGVPECPAEDASAKASAYDLSSDSEKKQREGVFKGSGRKNDQDGSGCSSLKRKEVEKTSPPENPLSRALLLTPGIPIREVRPEGVISQVKSGVEVDAITSVQRQTEEIIPATIGLLPMDEGVSSQPTDGNEDTVQEQESNASPDVMVLEVPNVHPPPPALTSRLSIPEMRRGVKHMISRLRNGIKPVQENLLGDLQRLLANLDRAQPGPSSSATATS